MIKKVLLIISFIFMTFSFVYWVSANWKTESQRNEDCSTSWDCIDKENFMIDTSLFSPGWDWLKKWESKDTINFVLWTLIQKLMIGLWIIALLIMTIWAWYMIAYHGEDELLSKWKNIFIAWITSLVVALSAYYLISLVWYLLYK